MKKSSFVVMVMASSSGLLFAIGMCMALLPEWDVYGLGVILGSVGIVLSLVTLLVWRKMEHKAPIRFTVKTMLTIVVSFAGILAFGTGMCFCMVYGRLIPGILIGIAGIAILMSLFPIVRGIK